MPSGKNRDYFGDGDPGPQAPLTYWRDPQLEDIFSNVNPAVQHGFDTEFTPADEREGRVLFHQGFVDKEVSYEVRRDARQEFFDWLDANGADYDAENFWDDWRDWYDSQ